MRKSNWPFYCAILLSLLAGAIARPTGNFPLNDDWQYAHVAKTFAETGSIRVDVPVAPSLVLQTLAGGAFIKWFGFSHFNLRLLTVFVSFLFLFVFDRILKEMAVKPLLRAAFLANCALNPLFLHFQWSFMTELYGYTIAFAGLWLWILAKRNQNTGLALAAVAVIAGSFWVRQFCVLLIPCLFLADWRERKARREFFLHWGKAGVISAAIIGGYFYWVRASGNFKPQFALPLSQLLVPDVGLWLAHLYVFPVYLLFFLAPFFILTLPRYREVFRRRFWRGSIIIFFLICLGVGHRWMIKGGVGYVPKSNFNQLMPYLGNVLTPMGLGPITTTDVYIENRSPFPAAKWLWLAITIALFLLLPTLIFLIQDLRLRWRESASDEKRLLRVLSGAIFIHVFFAIQAYHRAVFDRYYFPAYLAALLMLAWLWQRFPGKLSRTSVAVAIALQGLLGAYATLGSRDYFAWNEARWQLVESAQRQGLLPQLDGGYEVNGWLHYETYSSLTPASRTLCGPAQEFFCGQLPYQIAWTLPQSGKLIQSQSIRSSLYSYPPLLLIQKLIP